MKKKALYGALAVVATLAMTGLGASGAQAAQTRTLPTGESLYSYSNDDSAMIGVYDVATGGISLSTAVTDDTGQQRHGGYDWNTKTAYTWNNQGALLSYDAAGAQTTVGQPLVDVTGEPFWDPTSSSTSTIRSARGAIDKDGNAYVLGYVQYYNTDTVNWEDVWYVWPVNLTDASVGTGVSSDFSYPNDFAYNPADGLYYLFDGASNGTDLYTFDVTTGVSTYVTTSAVDTKKYWFSGVTFDSAGVGWATDTYWEDASNSSTWGEPFLCSFTITGFATSGDIECADAKTTFNSTDIYGNADWVTFDLTPATPELPNTGVDATTLAMTVPLLLATGIALVVVRRRAHAG